VCPSEAGLLNKNVYKCIKESRVDIYRWTRQQKNAFFSPMSLSSSVIRIVHAMIVFFSCFIIIKKNRLNKKKFTSNKSKCRIYTLKITRKCNVVYVVFCKSIKAVKQNHMSYCKIHVSEDLFERK
jgi:hypothetical protein